MKFIRIASYLSLAVTLIVSIYLFLNSERKAFIQNAYQFSGNNDLNILVHPEKYLYFDTARDSKHQLNGTSALLDNSDIWTEFIPNLYIHSAFADEKRKDSNEIIIRIIAVGSKLNLFKDNLQCVFQNNQTVWRESLADSTVIRHWSFRYYMLICASKSVVAPLKVRLEKENTQIRSQFLEIHYQGQKYQSKQELTLCIPPLFENSDNIELLAEFLSYYDTVGVSSFIFYNYNMTNDTKLFLNMVSRSGINITIISWTIPNVTVLAKKRIMQIASVQHCIFRNRGMTKYVLPISINEFLVPRQHFSLIDLMEELSTISKQKVGSYIFRKSYFCSKENISKKKQENNLVSSRDIFREDKIWPAKKKSRYMVRPGSVTEGGLYYIRKHLEDWKSANVPWQLALVHHYASCSKKNASKFIEDRTAESFKYEILLSKPMMAFREFKLLHK